MSKQHGLMDEVEEDFARMGLGDTYWAVCEPGAQGGAAVERVALLAERAL